MKKLFLGLLVVVFAAGCTTTVTNKVPNLNTLDFTKKMILEETDRYTIEVETISINETDSLDTEKINETILYGFQIFIDLFMKNQEETELFGESKHALSIETTPFIYNEDLISMELSVYEYFGAAHPNTYKTGLTYIIKDDIWLLPGDLANTEENMKEILNIFSNESYQHISFNYPNGELDEEWLEEGTAPTELNFFDFSLTPNGILLYIPTYQATPYAVGAFEVPIDYSQVKEWITEPTILDYIAQLEQ